MNNPATPDTPLTIALKRARRRGVHPSTLAKRLGLPAQYLHDVAAGTREPTPWIAREIAAALRDDVDALFPHRNRSQDGPQR